MTSLAELLVLSIQAFAVFAILFFVVVNTNYLLIHVVALLGLYDRKRESEWDPPYQELGSPFLPGIAVIVPAYNEAETIEENLRSLLSLEYPDAEVVVVNDGSTDDTLGRLRAAYDLSPIDAEVPFEMPCEPVRQVYGSATHENLLVVDKENGGKSDALNAGVWLTDKELFCSVDADTVIDRSSLLQVVRPFREYPERVVATGGSVRLANRSTVEFGQVTDVVVPSTPLLGLQVVEYLRAFYSGRLGLDRLGGLILISGAFGVFRTDIAREVGGYRRDTVTEDFDFVLRIHRHMIDADREYDVTFVPEPVAWTEAPETLAALSRQRRRWYRGMVETLATHRDLIGRRKYGRVGTYALPYFLLSEAVGPILEGFGYLLLPVMALLGILDPAVVLMFFLVTSVFGVFLSWFCVFSEVSTYRRYGRASETAVLLAYGILENVGYRQWKAYIAWRGLYEYLTGIDAWGRMSRTGFGTQRSPDDD